MHVQPEAIVEVLVLSGPAGVGKSSVGNEIDLQLERRGIAHALIDTNELDRIYPRPDEEISEENLGALWRTFRRHGATRLIVIGVYLDQPSQLEWLARAVPGSRFKLVRLRASEVTLTHRVLRREVGSGAAAQVDRTKRQLAQLSSDTRSAVVVDVDDRSVQEAATRIIALWLPEPLSELKNDGAPRPTR